MIKYLVAAACLYAIYFIFFKKKSVIADKKRKQDDSEETVECNRCSTYVGVSDVLMVDGKYYCSKECIER